MLIRDQKRHARRTRLCAAHLQILQMARADVGSQATYGRREEPFAAYILRIPGQKSQQFPQSQDVVRVRLGAVLAACLFVGLPENLRRGWFERAPLGSSST